MVQKCPFGTKLLAVCWLEPCSGAETCLRLPPRPQQPRQAGRGHGAVKGGRGRGRPSLAMPEAGALLGGRGASPGPEPGGRPSPGASPPHLPRCHVRAGRRRLPAPARPRSLPAGSTEAAEGGGTARRANGLVPGVGAEGNKGEKGAGPARRER